MGFSGAQLEFPNQRFDLEVFLRVYCEPRTLYQWFNYHGSPRAVSAECPPVPVCETFGIDS
jgi:hypothetical protein